MSEPVNSLKNYLCKFMTFLVGITPNRVKVNLLVTTGLADVKGTNWMNDRFIHEGRHPCPNAWNLFSAPAVDYNKLTIGESDYKLLPVQFRNYFKIIKNGARNIRYCYTTGLFPSRPLRSAT